MHSINYWPLFLIFVIAWGVPILLTWLKVAKMPAVIVEITMGVIIGPHVLNLLGSEPYLDFLAYTGFLFLIFLSGLETDIQKIINSFPRGKLKVLDFFSNSFIVAFFIYICSLILSYPAALIITYYYPLDIIFLMLMLPTVALSFIVPILKSDGELNRKFGQILLLNGAIVYIMTIILISIYAGIKESGFKAELMLFIIIFVAFFAAYKIGGWLTRFKTFRKLSYTLEHAASQIRVRGSIAVMLAFVVIAGLINTELIMGAFFAGSLLSLFLSKERSALLFKLDGMSYGFFIPIFFIMVGVKLDLTALKNIETSLPFVALLIISFYAIQLIPSFIMTRIFGFRRALAAGLLLTTRLGMTIAVGQIGMELGIISPAINAGIVVAAIITCVISPLFYKMLNEVKKKVNKIYIVGGSEVALQVAERLKLHGMNCLVIESRGDAWFNLQEKDIEVMHADVANQAVYEALKVQPTETVIVLTESVIKNQKITRLLKEKLGHNKIITLGATEEDDFSETQYIQIDKVLASHVENLIVRPSAIQTLSESFGQYAVEEILMTNRELDGKMVKKVAFPDSGSLVMIRRNKEILIPHGDTHLLIGDMVTVIGNATALEEFRNILD